MAINKRLILFIAIGVVICVFIVIAIWKCRTSDVEVMSNYRFQSRSLGRWLAVEEPIIRIDNPRLSSVDAYYRTVILIDEGNWHIYVPHIEQKQPLRGFMDSVYMGWMRESPLRKYVHSGETYPLPYESSVVKYVILIKSAVEDTDWRIYEWPANTSPELRRAFMIPDIITLPKLKDHPEGQKLWDIYMMAEQEFDQSQVGHGYGSL